jgi:hypothetical protein
MSTQPPARRVWQLDQIRALGAATSLPIAARILGLSYPTARRLALRGQFPVPVTRAGTRWIVPTAPLLALLEPPAAPAAPHPERDEIAADLTQPVESSVADGHPTGPAPAAGPATPTITSGKELDDE